MEREGEREREREKEGEKIENQNEEEFINRACDLWLFIHGITKEDFGTECPANININNIGSQWARCAWLLFLLLIDL